MQNDIHKIMNADTISLVCKYAGHNGLVLRLVFRDVPLLDYVRFMYELDVNDICDTKVDVAKYVKVANLFEIFNRDAIYMIIKYREHITLKQAFYVKYKFGLFNVRPLCAKNEKIMAELQQYEDAIAKVPDMATRCRLSIRYGDYDGAVRHLIGEECPSVDLAAYVFSYASTHQIVKFSRADRTDVFREATLRTHGKDHFVYSAFLEWDDYCDWVRTHKSALFITLGKVMEHCASVGIQSLTFTNKQYRKMLVKGIKSKDEILCTICSCYFGTYAANGQITKIWNKMNKTMEKVAASARIKSDVLYYASKDNKRDLMWTLLTSGLYNVPFVWNNDIVCEIVSMIKSAVSVNKMK